MSASAVHHSATNGIDGEGDAFNNWPNDAGFETLHEETEPVELKVSGKIPAYAAGVLYRTGPGGHQIETRNNKTFQISHWFDGFAQTHRFVLYPPANGDAISRITYNSRHTCDEIIEKVRNTGKLSMISFGQRQDPCESFFKKVMSSFFVMTAGDTKTVRGANVAVTVKVNMPMPGQPLDTASSKDDHKDSSSIKSLWTKTDNVTFQSLNPETLEPIDISRHSKLHPALKGPFTAAHSRTDPVTGDWYNYNLEIGRLSIYRIFCVSAETGKCTILATVSGGPVKAAYIHSFMLTERYVVLCIFSSYFAKGGAKVLWTRNMLDAMDLDPNKRNVWLVIDRRDGKGLVGIYESAPFFAFHPCNAWDQPSETEPGKFDIITDIPTYDNLDILKRFYYDRMKSTSASALPYVGEHKDKARASLARFKLCGIGDTTITTASKPGEVKTIFTAASADTPELPTFNPRHATKPSRYIYGVSDRGNSTFLDGLLKYDTETQKAQAWSVHAQSPGEPIFLPNPNGTEEDDGVCLSVVLDGTEGKSYLLVLNARSFEEIGRAEMEIAVPFGFHGTHVSNL